MIRYVVGWASYDYEGDSDIEMWIRESIIQKLESMEYRIAKTERYKRDISIVDNFGVYIEPVKRGYCY